MVRTRYSARMSFVFVDQRQRADLELGVRHHEPARAISHRQVHLGGHARRLAHLQVPHPLAAVLGDLGQRAARGGVERGIALEVVLQLQPEAQIVRPPGIAARVQRQAVVRARSPASAGSDLHQAIVEDLEVALAVQLADALLELGAR